MDGDRIAVVGGGAAGLAAAICAARAGAHVTVLERNERVGKSILATGDGRCNIANAATAPSRYRNEAFVGQAFRACSPQDALAFLQGAGLLLREEAQGRLYPLANKATSVVDALRLAALRAGVRERCGCDVRRVLQGAPAADAAAGAGGGSGASGLHAAGRRGWRVELVDGQVERCGRVVVACGAAAGARLLPDAVPCSPFQPVLAPLATDTEPLRGLDKVRARCRLQANGHVETGEVTFRAYGISGIAAFDLSRFVQPGDGLSIDFLPGWEQAESLAMLQARLDSLQPQTWLDLTCGMLLPLVARAVLRAAALPAEGRPQPQGLEAFHQALRAFPLQVRGVGDARLCQAHRGGVAVDAVDPATMEVRGLPGLHVAGELLDVDGPCGGYNLHWAWASGIIAGQAAAAACDARGARGAEGGGCA